MATATAKLPIAATARTAMRTPALESVVTARLLVKIAVAPGARTTGRKLVFRALKRLRMRLQVQGLVSRVASRPVTFVAVGIVLMVMVVTRGRCLRDVCKIA